MLQNAGSQEMRNGFVEDFRTALDMLTQAAPVSSISSVETGTNIWHDFLLGLSLFFVLQKSFNEYFI